MFKISEIKKGIKQSAKGHWWRLILPMFLFSLILIFTSSLPHAIKCINEKVDSKVLEAFIYVFAVISGIVFDIINYQFCAFYLRFSRTNEWRMTGYSKFLYSFKHILVIFVTNVLKAILCCLAAILLIVPGIILAISYSQTDFILADNPDMGPIEALRKSRRLMDDHKAEFFVYKLSYIGWWLLCLVTLGIACFFVNAYIFAVDGRYYDYLRSDYESHHRGTFLDLAENNYTTSTSTYNGGDNTDVHSGDDSLFNV